MSDTAVYVYFPLSFFFSGLFSSRAQLAKGDWPQQLGSVLATVSDKVDKVRHRPLLPLSAWCRTPNLIRLTILYFIFL